MKYFVTHATLYLNGVIRRTKMGVRSEIFLMDEFDWEYVGQSRATTIEKIEKLGYEVRANELWRMIVIYVDKEEPIYTLKLFKDNNITWDIAYLREDCSVVIKELDSPDNYNFQDGFITKKED